MGKKLITCTTQTGTSVKVEPKQITIRVSAYGLLIVNEKILVVQTHLPLWEFPGGAIEPEESLKDGLIREFFEETKIKILIDKFLFEQETFYYSPSKKVYHSFQHFFIVNSKDDDLLQIKGKETKIAWISPQDLSQKNMNLDSYSALKKYLTKNNDGRKFIQ